MWPDWVSNPGPLTYESGALPIALRGPAFALEENRKPSSKCLMGFQHTSSDCPIYVNGSGKNTTQNSLRVTFTRSCQHFLPKRILKFLLYQSWKLIQKCCLQVSSSSLFSTFSKHGSGLFGGHILHCTMFVLQVPSFFSFIAYYYLWYSSFLYFTITPQTVIIIIVITVTLQAKRNYTEQNFRRQSLVCVYYFFSVAKSQGFKEKAGKEQPCLTQTDAFHETQLLQILKKKRRRIHANYNVVHHNIIKHYKAY